MAVLCAKLDEIGLTTPPTPLPTKYFVTTNVFEMQMKTPAKFYMSRINLIFTPPNPFLIKVSFLFLFQNKIV